MNLFCMVYGLNIDCLRVGVPGIRLECAGVLGLVSEGALLMALALAIRQGTPALPMSDRLIELARTLQAAHLPSVAQGEGHVEH